MSQTKQLYNILSDNQPHRSDDLIREVYSAHGPISCRLAARIHDCKRLFHIRIDSHQDSQNKKLTWYQIIPHAFVQKNFALIA